MISDVLAEALDQMEGYLTNPAFAPSYAEPDIQARLGAVVAHMQAVRQFLDNPLPAEAWPLGHDPTLALVAWLLNLDGEQPDCYDLCWRDYVGQRPDEVLADCRNGAGCPFGRVLLLYPPAAVARAVRAAG
ncbi:MAG: hypothetical protein KKA73_00410 [Chloroflexi bacterium]|nr:hypothetical protein [Chloroflexota bacterium]